MQLFKFSMLGVSTAGTLLAIFAWNDMDPKIRRLVRHILIMTYIASIPGAVDAFVYVYTNRAYIWWAFTTTLPTFVDKPPFGFVSWERQSDNAKGWIVLGMFMAMMVFPLLYDWSSSKNRSWSVFIVWLAGSSIALWMMYHGATLPPVR